MCFAMGLAGVARQIVPRCVGRLKMSDLGLSKVSLSDAARVPGTLRHRCRTGSYDLKCKREPSLWDHPQQGDSSLVLHLH